MLRNLATNIALALAASLLTLMAVESLARTVDLRPSRDDADAIPTWVEDAQLQHDSSWLIPISKGGGLGRYFELFEWDRHRFYRLRPHLSLDMLDYTAPAEVRHRTGWRAETNSDGFRDGEFEPPEARPSFRIAAIGDSSTFGWGVDEPASFVSVAERKLAAEHPHLDVEVLNYGTPGHSSFQGVVHLREILEAEDIHAVWFSFGANDRLPTGVSDRDQYARRASWAGALQVVLQRSQAIQTGVEWRNHLRGSRSVEDIPTPEPGASITENVTLDEYTDNLRQAAQLTKSQGVPLAFISSCLDREGIRTMRRVAREQDVPFVNGLHTMMRSIPELESGDLLADEVASVVETYGHRSLQRWDSKGWVLMPDRCHPNRVGHHLIGRAVAEVASAWIPDGQGSDRLD
jgi:lysophospholipase L1-like esterase